ncbi:MAG: CRISPR-associated endonuclease Cas3'' [Bacillota bacterium]
MLVAEFKNNLGKSSHGGETLYDHTMDCVKIAHKILTNNRFVPANYPNQKRDQLLFATFIHDIGKLDPDFQAMLRAARDGERLPPRRVKHEASTLNFEQLVRDAEKEVIVHLEDTLNYGFTEGVHLEDALAFAITHHGLFYLSFEQRNGEILLRIRREWTVFNYGEKRRVTLADLLFKYHPLGGLVIIADLLSSFCYEQGIPNAGEIIDNARSLRDLIEVLLREGAPEIVEKSLKQYELRTHGLRDLLILLAGGLA